METIIKIEITKGSGEIMIAGEYAKIVIEFCKLFDKRPEVKQLMSDALKVHTDHLNKIKKTSNN